MRSINWCPLWVASFVDHVSSNMWKQCGNTLNNTWKSRCSESREFVFCIMCVYLIYSASFHLHNRYWKLPQIQEELESIRIHVSRFNPFSDTCRLDKYCFASSFAAGLESDDEEMIGWMRCGWKCWEDVTMVKGWETAKNMSFYDGYQLYIYMHGLYDWRY